MNTGQTFLAVGAIILLSSMVLRFNRTVLTSDEVMYNSKFNVLASSLCVSVIEEARGKAFDQNTDSAAVSNVNQLSATLGPDFGETYEDYNDFDDYNGYVKTDSTMPSAIFYITAKVTYVKNEHPIKPTANRTWHKMITVTILSSAMKDPVKMSSTYSYWFYR